MRVRSAFDLKFKASRPNPKRMESAASAPNAPLRISWTGDCCIASVGERLPELLEAARGHGPVQFDAGKVSRIDTAGLQLVAALWLELVRQNRAVSLTQTSEAFAKATELSGLTHLFGLDSKR